VAFAFSHQRPATNIPRAGLPEIAAETFQIRDFFRQTD
jgi:hypothetical protein